MFSLPPPPMKVEKNPPANSFRSSSVLLDFIQYQIHNKQSTNKIIMYRGKDMEIGGTIHITMLVCLNTIQLKDY